jgi:hypothetical protein
LYTTTGSFNTAVGALALQGDGFPNVSTGYSNTAIGYSALKSITTGHSNTGVGDSAGAGVQSGIYNTAVGLSSLNQNIGSGNTTLGHNTILASGNGSYNTVLGDSSGLSISNGDYNTLVGANAGNGITTGANNIIIGSGSGGNITTGRDNTIIGKFSSYLTSITSSVILADGLGNVALYATGSKVAFGKSPSAVSYPNATVDVNGDTIITGSLIVTGPIRNIVNDGFVSCSIAVTGTNASRAFVASFLEVDGTALSNPRQLIHWWTSTSQFGTAIAIPNNTYAITAGTNVVPISNSGSINHAATSATGTFGVTIAGGNSSSTTTAWFHTEVQGIIYSLSATINNGSNA